MADRPVRRTPIRWATASILAATLVTAMAPAAAATTVHDATEGSRAITSLRPITSVRPILTGSLGAALQARLAGIGRKYAIPGMSVAIIFPDGTTWVGTTGMRDVATGAPVTPDTSFAIASVSKTFTSALVMSLVQDGRIALDAPVATYLPERRVDPAITVRTLLDHTSGLRDYFLDPAIDAALLKDRSRSWTEADSLAYVGKPYFKPGRGWHYSNTNYLLLGMLAERVGGASLGDQLRSRFFEPLGLNHTTYQPGDPSTGPVAHGYRFASPATDAPPIDLSDGTPVVPFTSVITAARGAGGIASTASDIARWARSLYDGPALQSATVATMVADVASTAAYRPRIPYGLGVQAVDINGHRALGHSGRLLGFRSVVRWLPDDGVTVAVLTNQSRTDPAIVARALLKIVLRSTATCACTSVR
jgi:CubicO group peptidase (beta-lactamase class C family)